MDMTLVVMAAGLGSRYGGVKQIERLGPDGEILMEYAIYDALRAGFDRIVLIIKPQMLQDVRDLFGDRIEQRTGMRIDYAFQTPDRFTAARPELAQRSKPLGTVHAVLCARDVIRTPFAVINADDFYGRGAIDAIAAALPELHGVQDAAMVGYRLKNTVSPFGTVTRGVCATENGLLRKVQETYKIQLGADGTIRDTSDAGAGVVLDPEAIEHLDDVFGVLATAEPVVLGVLIAAVLTAVGVGCASGRRTFGTVLLCAGLGTIAIFAILGIWAAIDFEGLFAVFHSLFFAQGSWVFSADSLLITMYPEPFWIGMGAIWLATTIAVSAVSAIAGFALRHA